MTKRFDVVSTGECLIDVLLKTGKESSSVQMTGNAGGAPVNVLAALSRLNCSTSYLGKISRDAFGQYLIRVMQENGIDTSGVVLTDDQTTLAMVSLNEKGDRDFSFYREGTADVNYSKEDVNTDIIRDAKVFHFGSVSMVSEPSRTATLWAAKYAKECGVKVSFDPNLRPVLWKDPENARPWIEEGLAVADYVKVSEEELVYLTGTADNLEGARELLRKYPITFLAVTLGPKGCACFSGDACAYEQTYDTNCIDTTGSGDACWGAILSCLVECSDSGRNLSREALAEIAQFGNAAGALCASKHGAIYSMATKEEILECMRRAPRLVY